jgi:hypothetical protein
MPSPTSIFKFVSGGLPQSISSAVTGALPGLPGIVSASISSGIGNVIGQLGIPQLGGFGGSTSSSQGPASPLTEFLADIQTHGVAWNNRFYARITPPQTIKDIISDFGERVGGTSESAVDPQRLMLRADMAELPGMTWATGETKYLGPTFRRPVQQVFTDLSLNFIVSGDLVEKYFFDYWSYAIKDSSDLYSYFNDIIGEIEVTLYTAQYEAVYGVKFYEVWPISINPIQLSWQDQDTMRLSVSFAYTRWDPLLYSVPSFSLEGGNSNPGDGSRNFFKDFAFNVLPSIPGASKFLGYANMTSGQLIKSGISMAGNAIKTSDPISQTLIGAGTATLSKLIGG